MLKSNYFIRNRAAQEFSDLRIAGSTCVFIGDDGKVLDFGVVPLGEGTIYAALYCDAARNVTLVTEKAGTSDVLTILWMRNEDYRRDLERLRSCISVRLTRQNTRLNRYAEAVSEKLREGVRIRVTEEVDKSDMAVCPECGTLNPPGSRYCLDCGAEITN